MAAHANRALLDHQLAQHFSLVSHQSPSTSARSLHLRQPSPAADTLPPRLINKSMISLLSNLRRRASNSRTNHSHLFSQSTQSTASPPPRAPANCLHYDDSDEIPWFGATEAAILASASRPSGPAPAPAPHPASPDHRSDQQSDHHTDDDYIAFQSLAPRPRLLSVFDRQGSLASSASLDSLDQQMHINVDDLYRYFLDATRRAPPPSLAQRIKRRRSRFAAARPKRLRFTRR